MSTRRGAYLDGYALYAAIKGYPRRSENFVPFRWAYGRIPV